MKINIGYKFQESKIFNLKTLAICLLLVILCELYFIRISPKNEDIENSSLVTNHLYIKKNKNIGNIRKEVTSKELKVKSINKEGEEYLIEASITGIKEDFLQKVKKLRELSIKDYQFSVEKDFITGKITINY